MKDRDDNVVRFRPRKPEPPKAKPLKAKAKSKGGPQPYRANAYGRSEPAIRWEKAPKAAVIMILIFAALTLVSALANWTSRIGAG